MRKKILLSAFVMLCLTIGACGRKETSPVTITPNESKEKVVEEKIEEKEEQLTEEVEEAELEPQKTASGVMFASRATIEETVLVNQDDVKITATGIDYTDTCATLHLMIENNTTEDRSFYSATAGYSMNTINGCVVPDGYVNSDVSAGMKALEDVYFDRGSLLPYGIYDISEIGMSFYVEDSDNKTLFTTDLVTIPTSIYDQCDFSEDTIKKAIDDGIWENELSMKLSYKNTDFVCTNDGLNITSVVIAESQYDYTSILLELENTTDKTVTFCSNNITLNGVTVSRGRWDSYHIPANKRALAEFRLDYLIDEEYRSLISKDNIGELSFELSHVDNDSYDEISSANVSVVFDENAAVSTVNGSLVYDANGIKFYTLPVTVDDYDMYYYVPIYIENNNGAKINVDLDNKSFAMGGFMVDCLSFSETIDDGSNGVLKIEIKKDKAKDLQINGIEDFTTATCKFEIKNYEHYSKIDNPSVELTFQ